jgi:hypothetical protein
MNKRLVTILAVAFAMATPSCVLAADHVGPPNLYPDPTLTQGKADTLSGAALMARYTAHCKAHRPSCTYSQSHRNVPSHVHEQVYVEYNVPEAARNIASGEVDHFYPLCAGGSNDISNLWYQPVDNRWNGQEFGFHEKDDLETWVCKQIKAGSLNPQDAYNRIRTDWVAYYLEVKPPHQNFGE